VTENGKLEKWLKKINKYNIDIINVITILKNKVKIVVCNNAQ